MDILQATETIHSKSNLGNFQYQCLSKSLVNIYSYYLMVKMCFAVVCVEAGFLKSIHNCVGAYVSLWAVV